MLPASAGGVELARAAVFGAALEMYIDIRPALELETQFDAVAAWLRQAVAPDLHDPVASERICETAVAHAGDRVRARRVGQNSHEYEFVGVVTATLAPARADTTRASSKLRLPIVSPCRPGLAGLFCLIDRRAPR
jgi:hypothetical protein